MTVMDDVFRAMDAAVGDLGEAHQTVAACAVQLGVAVGLVEDFGAPRGPTALALRDAQAEAAAVTTTLTVALTALQRARELTNTVSQPLPRGSGSVVRAAPNPFTVSSTNADRPQRRRQLGQPVRTRRAWSSVAHRASQMVNPTIFVIQLVGNYVLHSPRPAIFTVNNSLMMWAGWRLFRYWPVARDVPARRHHRRFDRRGDLW